jgi:hypothetical protein
MFRPALLLALPAGASVAAQNHPLKIVLAGDSTVNDEGGWGTGFRDSFGPRVEVVNLARSPSG